MATDFDAVVVGGGLVGLAIAKALLERGSDVTLLERHARLGTETSSRNSEVIHGGLYYPPGSLRAKHCVEGRKLLYRFAEDSGVTVKRYGKLLVATSPEEIPRLTQIANTAAANGVDDLTWLSGDEARRLEPQLHCVAACLSPSTGVIDSHGLIGALEGFVTSSGGEIICNAEVTRIAASGPALELDVRSGDSSSRFTANTIIVAAGHGASALAQTCPFASGYTPPKTYPVKGHYFALTGKSPFSRLIYPMPQGAWLGVHLTMDVAGQTRFGPDIEWLDQISYDFEDADGARCAKFEREVRRFWPDLPAGALVPDYTGVRPKIYREGQEAADFRIDSFSEHGISGLVFLFGIESPGLTSCLSIGNMLAASLQRP